MNREAATLHDATLAHIDWSLPWLVPYREIGSALQTGLGRGLSVAQVLDARRPDTCPRFVASDAQGNHAYESFIARTGSVPTRDNLHDLFNGLVWLRFPALKRRLNALHATEIERRAVGATSAAANHATKRATNGAADDTASGGTGHGSRGARRDALTLFDENGALLCATPALLARLAARDWTGLFVTQRGLWRDAQLVLVGHALLEKLLRPRKPITAHVWLAAPAWRGAADDALLEVDPAGGAFAPLPVLGVPGWWPANEASEFYADAAVFRPAGSPR